MARFYNSDGSWYLDAISCPNNITLSWTTVWSRTTVWTSSLIYSWWTINCTWTYFFTWKPFQIQFNNNFTWFSWATYSWSYVTLINWSWTTAFANSSWTTILFSTAWLWWVDKIDDNFDSDNYLVNSTWTILTWFNYPNWYIDDDNMHRKKFFWYIEPNTINSNIFFNNKETNEVISGSINNSDGYNVKINTSSWYVLLDVDWTFDLKIVQFSKTKYDSYKRLSVLQTFKWVNIPSWNWYIQNDLSMSQYKTWSELLLRFDLYYYGIFITNKSGDVITYNLSAETPAPPSTTWSWIYIVPVDDTSATELKFLWNDISDTSWKYSYTQFFISWKK
jgi:hypothetical protein